MNWIRNTFWHLAALSLGLKSGLLNAQDDAHIRNLENRVTALEDRKDSCCVINPSARPYAPECWGIYLTVDPLLWQAHVDGLPITVHTTGTSAFFNDVGTSKVKNLHFNWDWGFRIGLGANLGHDAWDMLLQYTYWKSHASRGLSSNADQTMFPSQGHPQQIAAQTSNHIDSKWNIHLNVLDLENGREFFVSKYLTLRPHAGLRTAWISHEFTDEYKDIPPLDVRQDVKGKCRFWGIGIRMGLDTEWGFGCGWSAFANWAQSLLYNYFSLKIEQDSIINEDKNPLLRVDDFYHAGRQIIDMQIGLRYDWISCDECYHIGIEAGWEHHYFPGLNQNIKFLDDIMLGNLITFLGDLAIQGYFIQARFDF